MKTSIRHAAFAIAALVLAASPVMAADTYSSGYYYPGGGFPGTSNSGSSHQMEWKGWGGYRNGSHHDPRGDHSSINYYDYSLDYCKSTCEGDHQCKGVEYITSPHKQWHDQYHGGANSRCEIHYDKFSHCDKSGGTAEHHRKEHYDGCWVYPNRHHTSNPYGNY